MAKFVSKDEAIKAFQAEHDEDVHRFGCEIPECFQAKTAIEILNKLPIYELKERHMYIYRDGVLYESTVKLPDNVKTVQLPRIEMAKEGE